MQVRNMTIEEVQKVIERKDAEIRKLTKALVNFKSANDYAYFTLLEEKGWY